MSDSLKKTSDSLKKTRDPLICSFLVSDLSDLLTIAHFLSATCANRSFDLSEMSDSLKKEEMSKNEQFAHFFKKIFFFNRM